MWQANWLFSGIKGDGMKKTVKTVKKEYAIWIFVLLVFVFYLSWALAAPFDASPDESMRYQIVEFIVGCAGIYGQFSGYGDCGAYGECPSGMRNGMVYLENRRTVISEKRDREAVYSSGVLSSGNLFSVFLYQYGWIGTFYDSLDPVLLVQGV